MRAIKQKKDRSNLITGSRDKCKIPSRVLYNSMKFFKRGTIHRGVLWPAIYGNSVKLWRKTLDGVSFIGNACRPTNNQFGIVGIQVAGEDLYLNFLIKDAR